MLPLNSKTLYLLALLLLALNVPLTAAVPAKAPQIIDLPLPVKNQLKNKPKKTPNNLSAASAKRASELKKALKALALGNNQLALEISAALKPKSLDRDIINWIIALTPNSATSLAQYDKAISDIANWPGHDKIKRNREYAALRQYQSFGEILQFFAAQKPLTDYGFMRWAEAQAALKQISHKELSQKLRAFWRNKDLTEYLSLLFINKFQSFITPQDNSWRLQRLLLERKFQQAKAMVNMRSLTYDFANVRQFYEIIHNALRHPNKTHYEALQSRQKLWGDLPAYQFSEINLLRHLQEYQNAAQKLLTIKNSQKSPANKDLIAPASWCVEARILSREMLDLKQADLAYKLISWCKITDLNINNPKLREIIIDNQFHAGWYALRFLNKASLAQTHFRNLLNGATNPISKSRGLYWLARSLQALGQSEQSQKLLKMAAQYGSSFYGQLASAALKASSPPLNLIQISEQEKRAFFAKEPLRAIKRLEELGYGHFAELIYKHLGQELNDIKELSLLIQMAQQQHDYYLGLKIAKEAMARGITNASLTHPLGAISLPKNIKISEKAAIYAIARQESEFNPHARSPVGAIGMLQIMPQTAKKIAKAHKLYFSAHRLSHDANYNSLLSLYYLRDQLAKFSNSLIITFAAYNAGEGRARQWIARYGDPQDLKLHEVIDWLERIPYPETRNYVMRTMENYIIYLSLISGKANIEQALMQGSKG